MSAPVEVVACSGCGACLLTCPEHALRPVGGRLVVVASRCTGCGECIEVCPVDGIVEVTAVAMHTSGAEQGSWP